MATVCHIRVEVFSFSAPLKTIWAGSLLMQKLVQLSVHISVTLCFCTRSPWKIRKLRDIRTHPPPHLPNPKQVLGQLLVLSNYYPEYATYCSLYSFISWNYNVAHFHVNMDKSSAFIFNVAAPPYVNFVLPPLA